MSDIVWSYRDSEWAEDRDLVGYDVEGEDGSLGTVDKATADTDGAWLVVDTGPWIFGKKVLLPAGVVDRIDTANEKVFVSRAKDDIKNAPEYDEEMGFSEDYRSSLGDYYSERVGGRQDRL